MATITRADFGSGKDVVLMSGMFHRETESACRNLIERAAACLVPGGLVVVSDVFTDAGGAHPAFAAMFGVNMMLTAPDGGVHADADVKTLDGGVWPGRTARRAAAAADAASRRPGSETLSTHRWLCRLQRSAAPAVQRGRVCAGNDAHTVPATGSSPAAPAPVATPAPKSSVPPFGELKPLGGDRYQIGRIVLDKRARSFTVPGRVHVLGRPLEYLATAPGGMKEYEALLELDASGSEFNLACILLGLERDPKQGPFYQFSAAPVAGPRVTLDIAWTEGDKRRQVAAAAALLNPEAGVPAGLRRMGLHGIAFRPSPTGSSLPT